MPYLRNEKIAPGEYHQPTDNKHNFEWSFKPIGILIELLTGFAIFDKRNPICSNRTFSILIHRSLMLLVTILSLVFSYKHAVDTGNMSLSISLGNLVQTINWLVYFSLIPFIFFYLSFTNHWNVLWECFGKIEDNFKSDKNLENQNLFFKCRRVSLLGYLIVIWVNIN